MLCLGVALPHQVVKMLFAVLACLAISNSDMHIMRQRKLIFHEASKKFNEATESLNYGSPSAPPPSPVASRVIPDPAEFVTMRKRSCFSPLHFSSRSAQPFERVKSRWAIHPPRSSVLIFLFSFPLSRMGELADDVGSFFGSPCSVCGDRREIGTTGLEATCTGPEINACT